MQRGKSAKSHCASWYMMLHGVCECPRWRTNKGLAHLRLWLLFSLSTHSCTAYLAHLAAWLDAENIVISDGSIEWPGLLIKTTVFHKNTVILQIGWSSVSSSQRFTPWTGQPKQDDFSNRHVKCCVALLELQWYSRASLMLLVRLVLMSMRCNEKSIQWKIWIQMRFSSSSFPSFCFYFSYREVRNSGFKIVVKK